jgi:uncharacterized protein (UPF0264 family)
MSLLHHMPKLLVSVRNAAEARLALEAGVDLIDIKEPSAGPLGGASLDVMEEILHLIGRRRRTSIACGELLDSAFEVARRLSKHFSGDRESGVGPDFVKVGLAGCRSVNGWRDELAQFMQLLPLRSASVAVIYADWREANAPPPAEIVGFSRTSACAAVLIDTFDKCGPGLLRLWSTAQVQAMIDQVQRLQMPIVVAGQLTLDDAMLLAALHPDYVGVRGAVCRRDRTGDIDQELLIQWRSMLVQPQAARAPEHA